MTVLLIPVAGCAGRGSLDKYVRQSTIPTIPTAADNAPDVVATAGSGTNDQYDDSFVAVPSRLGNPDKPLPDWTPDLHRARIASSMQTHQSLAFDDSSASEKASGKAVEDTADVATVSAIGELMQEEDPITTVYRPATHRMQLDSPSDRAVELDTLELSAPKSEAQRAAEIRLAEALESEERAAAERQKAQEEVDARIEQAREEALRAEQLAQAERGNSEDVALDAQSGLEAGQPIDLGASLGMAGGNAWTIQLARQKTVEAHAEIIRAESIWLPSLQIGIGWNKHGGRIQTTEGNVIEASRNSLFLGGGATLGQAPIAGGSGGPFRLAADVAIAEAFFAPKIARRNFHAERFGVSVAKNQAMLQAGNAYINLLEAAGQVADAQAAIASADELVELTRKFEDAGAGALADVDRAVTERARLQQILQNATRIYRVRSAALAQRLRLDPTQLLQPADQYLVPISLNEQTDDPLGHIATALAERPEICEQVQRISALCIETRKEAIAPWIPNVTMTTSGGMFGGGTGSDYTNEGGRGDLDLQAVWELENMGKAVTAKRKRVASRLAQQRIVLADLRDSIRTEVVQANENVANYWIQIQTSESALSFAESSYQRNLLRVRNAEGLPIELLQAINARAEGLRARTSAVAAYNRSQLELLFAIGRLQG